MVSAIPFIAGTVVAAIATAQGIPSVRWREADFHGIGTCRMVFDVARNRFVAHGALAAVQPYLTFEWDGRRWEARRTLAAPPIRAGFGLAYDVGRSRVVLFGGSRNGSNSAFQLLNDLWEYDGSDWVDRSPAVRPPARQLLAMAYDFAGGRVLMTGGSTATSPALTETWAWNGSAWQQLAATAPPLANPEMASHVSTQRVVLVGARNGSGETWTFDGTSWNQAAAGVVPAAQSYRMATDIANDCVVLLVGDRTLEWHGSTWTPRPTTFDGRLECGLAADAAGRVLAFAGWMLDPIGILGTIVPLNDTWGLDATGATKLADGGPRNQLEVQVAYDLPRNRIVCVGARGNPASPSPTWEHDGTAWRVATATTPSAALGTRLCNDLLRGRTVRFGGYRLNGLQIVPNNDLWEWDGAQWNAVGIPGPTPRWHHAMAFDLLHGAVLLFGGLGQGNVLLGDTWQWDGAHWTLLATAGPTPRSQAAMTFDVLRARAVLFGGLILNAGTMQPTGDTWEWDGTSWLQRTPVIAPPARYDVVIGYDLAHQRTVLLGGANTTLQFQDLWTWDGSNWLPVPGIVPSNGMRRVGALRGDGSWLLVALGTDWVGAPSVAAVSVVGTACGGATLPVLGAFGDPVVASNSFAAELYRVGANAPFLFAIGAGTASTPIGAGCTVYLPQIDEARFGLAGPTGFAAVALPVPNVPQLIGLEVSLQAGALDATAPLGFALTNAVVARIGR